MEGPYGTFIKDVRFFCNFWKYLPTYVLYTMYYLSMYYLRFSLTYLPTQKYKSDILYGRSLTSSMIGGELSPSPSSSPSLDGVSGANKWQLFSAGFTRCKLVRFSRLLAIMEVAIHPLNNPRKLEKHYSTFRKEWVLSSQGWVCRLTYVHFLH